MLKKMFASTPTETDASVPEQISEELPPSDIDDITAVSETEDESEPVDPSFEDEEEEVGLPPAAEVAPVAVANTAEEIAAVRDLILALHPTIVPELIAGDSIDALIASIEPAQAAYSRIISNVSIPAGGNAPVTLDVESLPTFDKIRRGIANPRS